MKITILGSGTSCGVPQIGCPCEVCTSADNRDKRLRTSALVEVGGKHILIDCGPDFREQMLRIDFKPLDAVLITHEHYDHVGGLDDLRPYSIFGDVDVYAEKLCADHLMQRIPYCFTPKEKRYPGAEVSEYTAAPVFMDENAKCRHQWLIEFSKSPSDLTLFSDLLDKRLQEINSDYEAKRYKDITLQHLEIVEARPNLFNDWLKLKGKLGGQHKVPRLSNSREHIEQLLSLNAQ